MTEIIQRSGRSGLLAIRSETIIAVHLRIRLEREVIWKLAYSLRVSHCYLSTRIIFSQKHLSHSCSAMCSRIKGLNYSIRIAISPVDAHRTS